VGKETVAIRGPRWAKSREHVIISRKSFLNGRPIPSWGGGWGKAVIAQPPGKPPFPPSGGGKTSEAHCSRAEGRKRGIVNIDPSKRAFVNRFKGRKSSGLVSSRKGNIQRGGPLSTEKISRRCTPSPPEEGGGNVREEKGSLIRERKGPKGGGLLRRMDNAGKPFQVFKIRGKNSRKRGLSTTENCWPAKRTQYPEFSGGERSPSTTENDVAVFRSELKSLGGGVFITQTEGKAVR